MTSGLGALALVSLFGGAWVGGPPQPTRAIEWQHVRPTATDRDLTLDNLSVFVAEKTLLEDRLALQLGLTATRARGQITQLEGRFEDGTLRSERLDSPAWGLGPTVGARLRLADRGGLRLGFDVSGSLMFYDRDFPSGGSRVNGMLQAGPSLSLALGQGRQLTAGLRWTHISNGQGLGAHNPSFDGRGVHLQFQRALGPGRRTAG